MRYSYVVSVHAPEVVEQGITLLQGIGYRGLADVEFKKDPRDGRFKLMEINIRSATHVAMAIDLGVDIPYTAYRDALDLPVAPGGPYDAGHCWIDFGQDFGSFLHNRALGRIDLKTWLASVMKAKSYAYFAWDDPAPGLARLFELVRDARRQLGSTGG